MDVEGLVAELEPGTGCQGDWTGARGVGAGAVAANAEESVVDLHTAAEGVVATDANVGWPILHQPGRAAGSVGDRSGGIEIAAGIDAAVEESQGARAGSGEGEGTADEAEPKAAGTFNGRAASTDGEAAVVGRITADGVGDVEGAAIND